MASKREIYLKEKIEYFEKIGFEPIGRPDLPATPISLPFNWGADPYSDNNWCFQLNTLRYLMIYADAFNFIKEKFYIEKLLAYIQDWSEFSKNNPNSFAWHDMATGIRAEKISYVIDVLKENNIKVPTWLNELVISHVNKMIEKNFINIRHNHGLYVIHGLRSLSKHVGPGMRQNILKLTKNSITTLFQSQFDTNFIHKEHSPHYHHLVTESVGRYLKTGLYDDVEFLSKCYENAKINQQYFYLPDGREVPFGDTDGAVVNKSFEVNTERNEWVFFNKSGYFISTNANGSYLALTNSYHSNIHKHNDNLSLIFGYKGEDLLADPGKYKYTNDDIRKEIISSGSHSVINFSNKPWAAKDLVQPLCDYVFEEHLDYFIVRNNLKINSDSLGFRRKELLWNRTVINHDLGFLVVIDTVDQALKNLVTRFTLDPSQISFEKGSEKQLMSEYEGKNFRFHAYTIKNNNIYEPILFKYKNVPVSKEYGSYLSSHQLEVDIKDVKTYSIFILNKDIAIKNILDFLSKL